MINDYANQVSYKINSNPNIVFGKESVRLDDGHTSLICRDSRGKQIQFFSLDLSTVRSEIKDSFIAIEFKDYEKRYSLNGKEISYSELNNILDFDISEAVKIPELYAKHYRVSFFLEIHQELDEFRRTIYEVQKQNGIKLKPLNPPKIFVQDLTIEVTQE